MYQQGYPPQGPQGYGQPQGYPPQQPYGGGGGMQQYYMIVSRMNGLVLDVQGANRNAGAQVITWNKSGNDNQLWYDDYSTGTIRSKLNGFCLDLEHDGALRLMPFQMGDQNQQWERDMQQGYIRSRRSHNRVLDILNKVQEPGAKVGAWDANGGPNQLWQFEPAGGGGQQYPHAQPYQQYGGPGMPRREFHLTSEMHGKVLDVRGGNKDPGTNAIVFGKHSPPSKNQLWYLDQQGFMRSALNDFALDARPGDRVRLQPFNGGSNQQWAVEGNVVRNRSTGEVLDIVGGSHDDDTEICSYANKQQKNQLWRVEYVN